MAWSPYQQQEPQQTPQPPPQPGYTQTVQPEKSFFKRQYEQQQRAQQQATQQFQASPDQRGTSPTGSDGRITPSAPSSAPRSENFPTQGGQQMAGGGAVAPQQQFQQAQNTGAQTMNAPMGGFNQNQWTGMERWDITDPAARAEQLKKDQEYWQWAMKEQTGNQDFWGTLQEGTSMSGSPDRVWVKAPDGNWGTMSKNDYLTQQRGGMPADVPDAALYRAGDLGNERFATYNPANIQANLPGQYNRTQFSQFQGPNQQRLDDQQRMMFEQMLQNPETMNPNVVSAMKNQLREVQNQQLAAQNAATGQRFAAMGRLGGGMQQGMEQAARDTAAKNILSGNRDIMLAKAERDRADQLAAAQGATAFQQAQMGRYSDAYKNAILGQQSQATENQYGQDDLWKRQKALYDTQTFNAGEGFKGYQSQFDAQKAAITRALEQQGLNQEQARIAGDQWAKSRGFQVAEANRQTQEKLGLGQLDIDRQRVANQASQFDKTFGEGQRQFDISTGVDVGKFKTGTGLNIGKLLASLGME